MGAHDIGSRLRAARESLALTQAAMAQKLAISHGAIKRLEGGGNVPNGETLLKYAGLGFNPGWILIGISPMQTGDYLEAGAAQTGDHLGMSADLQHVVLIPRYDIAAAAGAGALVEDGPPAEHIPFHEILLRGVRGNPRNFLMIEVAGDSMEPTLPDGAPILVDRSMRTVSDGIYVFRLDGQLSVKRLQLTGRALSIMSDNPLYPTRELAGHDLEHLKVLGKVIWPLGK